MLVSVIMPYFRKREYVKDSVQSILNQTYKEFELIIIYDDPIKDDLDIINQLKKLDERILIIENDKNQGAGESRNIGINHSKGSYIAFIDSDDVWNENKLLRQIEFMKKSNYLISHTSYKIIDKTGNNIGLRKAKNLNYNNLIKSCDIGLSSVVLKKDLIDHDTKFVNLKTKEDFVFWLKIAKKGIDIHGLDEVLLTWRKAENSLSSSTARKLIDGFHVYNKYLEFNILKSFYYLMILSINYIRKNL